MAHDDKIDWLAEPEEKERPMSDEKTVVNAPENSKSELIERLGTWQPIDTAPRDGTEVLLVIPVRWQAAQGRIGTGLYVNAGWFDSGLWRNRLDNWVHETAPTHWMPLPAPPEST